VKRATAIKRLTDVADSLDRAAEWPDVTVTAAYVYGALLRSEPEFERVEVALVVDEPPEEVPWMSRPRHLESLAALLRFTKLPLTWRWRPAQWPIWNHEIDRAVRFWTAPSGRDHAVLDALANGSLDAITVEAPATPDELLAELQIEHDVSHRNLAKVIESFYEQDWRRAHRGDGIYPEDHLWWATAAFLELDDAVAGLDR
jgi:hypothetical protein